MAATAGKLNLAFIVAITVGTFGSWAATNQPRLEAPWPTVIDGYAFSPLRRGQEPARGQYPTPEEIDSDLRLLAWNGSAVRTYSLAGTLSEIPDIAARHGLDVTVGVEHA